MKKNTILGVAFSILAGGAMAQQASSSIPSQKALMNLNGEPVTSIKPRPNVPMSTKALGDTVWSDDFSTPANWTVDNAGEPAPFGWNIGSTVNSWWTNDGLSDPINSESGGNFAQVYNGDYNAGDQAISVIYTMTTASPIDIQTLAGTDIVDLQFKQFGALFNDDQRVQISTDGATWTDIFTNNDRDTYVGNNPDAVYDNAETIIVDISEYIDGNANTVSFRFLWTSRFPGETSPNAWTTFGWSIDDVMITTKPDYDANVLSHYWGTLGWKYFQIPLTQAADIEFSANVKNSGTSDLTNVDFMVDVTGAGTFNESSGGATITAGVTDSLFTIPFVPSTLGMYDVARSLSFTETDDVPANNVDVMDPFSFEVTDNIYARDNGVAEGYTFSGSGESYESGSMYDIFATQDVYGIDIVLSSASDIDGEFKAKIYEYDDAGTDYASWFSTVVGETENLYSEAGMFGTTTTLTLFQPVTLEAGKTYYVVVESFDGLINVQTGGPRDGSAFTYYTDGSEGLYATNGAVAARLNFDESLSLEENNNIVSGVSVFPNPSNDIANVQFNLANASDVTIQVTDIAGKEVATRKLGQVNGSNNVELDVTDYTIGMYNISIVSNETVVTKKFFKK